jgi:serine/threonine protein kinase
LCQDPVLRTAPPNAAGRTRLGELAPGSVFAGYRIECVLGRGGSSVVYLAEHLGLGRKVALKLIGPWLDADPSLRQRFVRESKLAASLDHPNVIPIYEAGEHDGQPFIAMRYVEGRDLRRMLDEVGPIDPTRAMDLVRPVAAALDAAHARGLVHRDVKPANILLAGGDDDVYLSDFGLTTRMVPSGSSLGGSRFVGTLDYAPPEQFEGKPLDGRADQYSLGCVLHECLAGSPPFRRPNEAALMRAHLEEPPPAVTASRPDLSPAIDAVVARAMSKSPDDRYATCGEMTQAAAAALACAAPAPLPSDTPPPTQRSRRTRSWRRLAAVGAAAALVTGAAVVAVPRLLDGGTAAGLLDYGPGMAIIDADTGAGIASIPASAGQPVEAIFAEGHFWVLNIEPVSFVQIEPDTGRVVRQITSPIDDVGSFTVDGNDLWITNYSQPIISRVDIRREREVARVDDLPGDGGSGGVLVADGSLWLARRDADDGLGILARLDPDTFEVEHLFRRLPGSFSLAYGDDGAVWTAGTWGHVNRIEPRTNSVTSTNVGGRNFYVAAGGGYGWTTDEARGVVYQLDDAPSVVATHPTAVGARTLAYSDGVVWVGNQDDGSVSAIDVATRSTTTYRFSHPLNAITAGAGHVLVQLAPGQRFDDVLAELDGDVATLFTGAYEFDPPDPALIWSAQGHQIVDATCAGLLRRASGEAEDGERLAPEVAAAMPKVSADGRSYTFTVRPGYRFSPPSGEVVTAETFRFSIERALSPELGAGASGPALFDDVVDFQANGDTLTITLAAPADDFLDRLTSPLFCPVPLDTPGVAGGTAVPVDSGAPYELAVASAGPYYIARKLHGEYTILLRNPNYSGSRPHRFDAIVLREGIDPELAGDLVASGDWDGITNLADVEETFADRIGCVTPLAGSAGVDLAALCVVSPP